MKDGSSLVVTFSSIPSSATHGLNADLSSEGSKDVLEDPNDEPTMKKRVSDFEEEESTEHEAEFMGMRFLILLSSLLLLLFFFFFFYYLIFIHIYLLIWSPFICMFIPLIVETFEEPGVATDIEMPTTTSPTAPVAPVYVIFSVPVFATPTVLIFAVPIISIYAISATPILTGPVVFLFRIFFFTYLL